MTSRQRVKSEKKAIAQKKAEKRKAFLANVTLYRRRIEFLLIAVPFILIVVGYVSDFIKTRDARDITNFFNVMGIAYREITANIFPIFIIFIAITLFITYITNKKLIKVLIAVSFILTTLFFIFIDFFLSIFITVRNFIYEYSLMIGFLLICIYICLQMFKKIRKKIYKTMKFCVEIFFISVFLYFGVILGTFNVFEFLKAYYSVLRNGVLKMKSVMDVVMLLFLIAVFTIIYSSLVRACRFHAKRHKEDKKLIEKTKSDKIFDANVDIEAGENKVKTIIFNKYHLPKIGICVPAYNEEKTACITLDSILASEYDEEMREIYLVADGSRDRTVEVVSEKYQMYKIPLSSYPPAYEKIETKEVKEVWVSKIHPNLKMIVKLNGGKHDAINVALKYFREDIDFVSVIDADTTLCKKAFQLLATEVMKSENILAVAGTILPREDSNFTGLQKAIFTNWQYFDYLCSFHLSRGSLSHKNAMMTVSGAFGFFNREYVMALGGYQKSLAEDTFLTLNLHHFEGGEIRYIPEAVAYTQVPITFEVARKQRMRWFKGLIESLSEFKKMPWYMPKMKIAFAEFFIVELLTPLLAPFGLFLIIANPITLASIIFQIAIGLAIITPMIQGLVGLIIESTYREVKWTKLFFLPVQLFMAPLVVLWRIDGLLDFSSKAWGKMSRT